ncbi:MAG: hypothetical protein ACK4RN_15600 [Pseudorhodobacter sp.]
MYHSYVPTTMQTPPRAHDQAAQQPDSPCAVFEAAREAACSDPVLGRLWLDLFDDANP